MNNEKLAEIAKKLLHTEVGFEAACEFGDMEAVNFSLDSGVTPTSNGLFKALTHRNLDIAERLMSDGLVLSTAEDEVVTTKRKKKRIKKRGSDVYVKEINDAIINNDIDWLELIVQSKAALKPPTSGIFSDVYSELPMCTAAKVNNVNICNYLYDNGANPWESTSEGNPLYIAIKSGSLDVVKFYIDDNLSQENMDSVNNACFKYRDNMDVVSFAILENQLEIADYLKEKGFWNDAFFDKNIVNNRTTPLSSSLGLEYFNKDKDDDPTDLEGAKRLIDHGFVFQNRYEEFLEKSIDMKKIESFKFLLNLEENDYDFWMSKCLEKNFEEGVSYLYDKVDDVYNLLLKSKSYEVLDAAIKKGFDVYSPNKKGDSFLKNYIDGVEGIDRGPAFVKKAIELGVFSFDKEKKSPIVQSLMKSSRNTSSLLDVIDSYKNFDGVYDKSETPLMTYLGASRKCEYNYDVLNAVFTKTSDLNEIAKFSKKTAFHHLFSANKVTSDNGMSFSDVLTNLRMTDASLDFTIQDRNGRTPLFYFLSSLTPDKHGEVKLNKNNYLSSLNLIKRAKFNSSEFMESGTLENLFYASFSYEFGNRGIPDLDEDFRHLIDNFGNKGGSILFALEMLPKQQCREFRDEENYSIIDYVCENGLTDVFKHLIEEKGYTIHDTDQDLNKIIKSEELKSLYENYLLKDATSDFTANKTIKNKRQGRL